MSKRVKITRGGGNVFADMGLPDPEDRKGMTQSEIAPLLGLDQPKVSYLMRGRLSSFSVERLFDILNRLGHNIEVHISEEEYAPDETHTVVA
jgi:transcriptional regulator with XRE-family HTH domain